MSEKFQPGEEVVDEVEGHMPFKRVAPGEEPDETEGHMPVMRGAAVSAVEDTDETEGHAASGRF